MRLVSTRQALQLTGISATTLREWTSRRALIPADVPPKKQGSPAQYSWQTILVLRVAVTLREQFHLELQAHREFFTSLRSEFGRTSFIALWGKSLVLQGSDDWFFMDPSVEKLQQDSVVILLNPHLCILSEGFALSKPANAVRQLDLFPATPWEQPDRTSATRLPGDGHEQIRRSK